MCVAPCAYSQPAAMQWCPPCQEMLHVFRDASRQMPDVRFGTVDCTEHKSLCANMHIRSYPTPIFYNGGDTTPHQLHGSVASASAFIQHVNDVRHPPVHALTPETFASDVAGGTDLWVVDFFAPWCGHCVQFAPEFTWAAKQLVGTARLGSVDCVAHQHLCSEQNVRAYPWIQAYLPGRSVKYSGRLWGQTVLNWVLSMLPNEVSLQRRRWRGETPLTALTGWWFAGSRVIARRFRQRPDARQRQVAHQFFRDRELVRSVSHVCTRV